MFYQSSHPNSTDYTKIERGTNFSFPAHLHRCFELILVLSGEMRITVDTREYCLHTNEALMIFPNQLHSLASEKSEHILCIFSTQLVKAYTTMHADHVPVNGQFLPEAYQTELLLRLTPDASVLEKKALLYALCATFDKTAIYEVRNNQHSDLLDAVFRFVETEFRGDCSLTRLSRTVGHEYTALSRYFKKTVGMSYNTYVHHYRLSNACYLMENTDYTILRCALDSGYTNMRSFNRHFIVYYGMTPSEYRSNQE